MALAAALGAVIGIRADKHPVPLIIQDDLIQIGAFGIAQPAALIPAAP
jgi:hypothetical protein